MQEVRSLSKKAGDYQMDAASTGFPTHTSNPLLTVVRAGLVCGVLDISAAFVVYGWFGLKPLRLLQGIASGVLGMKAFEGGSTAALLGLLCHFFIALSAAAVYFWLSRWIPFLLERPAVSGVLYGIAVYFFMNRIVLPLSAVSQRPFSFKMMVIGVVIHILCVGLPISLTIRKTALSIWPG